MAQWHLDELASSLESDGWRIVKTENGDGYRIAASWTIQRYGNQTLIVDFDGLDDMVTLPLEEAYACKVRGTAVSLYFGRRGDRTHWSTTLAEFISSIDQLKY
jgi:hypothetical protein